MTLQRKVILTGTAGVLAASIVLVVVGVEQSASYGRQAVAGARALSSGDLDHLTSGVGNLISAQGEAIQEKVSKGLGVADYLISQKGKVALAEDCVEWKAVNQLDKKVTSVGLPRLLVGGQWFGNSKDPKTTTPILDLVTKLTGCKTTVFQRMNAAGDMLRVATTVLGKDGNRAIGTYVPAINADAKPNPVVAATLAGKEYRGTAFVVDAWYVVEYRPICDSRGAVIGMLFCGEKEQSAATLREAVHNTKVGVHGNVLILGGTGAKQGQVMMSGDGKNEGESVWDRQDVSGRKYVQRIIEKALKLRPGEVASVAYSENVDGRLESKIANFTYFKPWDWVIVADAYQSDYAGVERSLVAGGGRLVWALVISGLIVAVLAALVSQIVIKRALAPVGEIVTAAKGLAEGRVDVVVNSRSGDELGTLADSFRELTDYVQDKALTAEAVSKGDLSMRIVPSCAEDRLGLAFREMVAGLREIIGRVRESAGAVSSAGSDMRTAAEQGSQAAEGLAGTAQESAAAMDALETAANTVRDGALRQQSGIRQTDAGMQEAAGAAGRVSDAAEAMAAAADTCAQTAERGGSAVGNTISAMQRIEQQVSISSQSVSELGDQGQQIGAIVATISDIAAQTNLLALNAAIEAARAGEQGKGFAVVAEEVRKLAERSSSATNEIAKLIENVRNGVDAAVAAMESTSAQVAEGAKQSRETGAALDQILSGVEGLAKEASGLRVLSKQMTGGVETVMASIEGVGEIVDRNESAVAKMGEAVEQLSRTVATTAATSQETSASAEEIGAMAGKLSQMADELARLVEQFQIGGDEPGMRRAA